MDPLTLAAIMAAVGVGKSELIDRPQAERQRKMEAAKARWSPWTGIAPGSVKEPDAFGAALQGGLTGAMMGQMGSSGAKDIAEADAITGQNISLAGGQEPLTPEEQTMTQPFYQQPAYGATQSMEDPYTLMARQRAMRGY